MKKLSFKNQFLFVSVTTYFFNIFFLVGALIGLLELFHNMDFFNFLVVIFMLYFSYLSFQFGLNYKLSFAKDLQEMAQKQVDTAQKLKESHDSLPRFIRRRRLKGKK